MAESKEVAIMENEYDDTVADELSEISEDPRAFLDRLKADVIAAAREPIPEPEPRREVPRKRRWQRLWRAR